MAYAVGCVGELAKSYTHTHSMWLQRNVSENSKDLLPFIEYILTLSLIPVNPLWMQRASIALEIKTYTILSLYPFEMLVVTCICYTTVPWNFANMYRQQTAFKLVSLVSILKFHCLPLLARRWFWWWCKVVTGEKAVLFTTIVVYMYIPNISAKTIHSVCTDLLVIPECRQPRKHWSPRQREQVQKHFSGDNITAYLVG